MDILIPFVDNNDRAWQEVMLAERGLRHLNRAARAHFLESMNDRFASYGLFKYWFRAIERNYKDLDKIHLLLMSRTQIPSFLANDERVVIHFHDEFIPSDLRPCFNSSVIELCAMKELELSDLYILSNDDMYAFGEVTDDMFSCDGKPKTYIRTVPKYGDSMFQGFLSNGKKLVEEYFNKPCPYYDWIHLWQVYDNAFCKKFLNDNWVRIRSTFTKFRESKNVNHLMCMMAQNLTGISVHSEDFPHVGYFTTGAVPGMSELYGKKIICLNDNGSAIRNAADLLENTFKYPSFFEKFSTITHGLPERILDRYTTLGTMEGMSYDGERKGVAFIHWYYVERSRDVATKCEAFHINMLNLFSVPRRVSKIFLRIVGNCTTESFAVRELLNLIESNGCEIDVSISQNNYITWEHDTFMECVEHAVSTGDYVYYMHFKGVSHFNDPVVIDTPRPDKHGAKMNEIDLMYWCYLMYRGLFDADVDTPAIGPLYRNGILRAYRKCDRSWSYTHTKNHYMGSFQAFDGKRLNGRFIEMGMDKDMRRIKIWNGNRYIVEQFLSMVFEPEEVHSILLGALMSYSMHTDGRFGPYLRDFDSIATPVNARSPGIKCRYAVVTYIYGGNEILRPVNPEPGVEYICVTDDETLAAGGWNIIVDKLDWLSDPRSKYHYVKLHPFNYVDAEYVMLIDGSYEIYGTLYDTFAQLSEPVYLKPHPKRDNIGEEVPEWLGRRGMLPSEASMFWNIAEILRGGASLSLYEFDVSMWHQEPNTREFLDKAWSIMLSCAYGRDTFMSNQLAISLLAGTLYKKLVSRVEKIPAIKHKHNVA